MADNQPENFEAVESPVKGQNSLEPPVDLSRDQPPANGGRPNTASDILPNVTLNMEDKVVSPRGTLSEQGLIQKASYASDITKEQMLKPGEVATEIPGLTSGHEAKLQYPDKTYNDDGSTTERTSGKLNDGYLKDTKVQRQVTRDSDGNFQSADIKYNPPKDMTIGKSIRDTGRFDLKGVTDMNVTKNADGSTTLKFQPVQRGVLGRGRSYDTLNVSPGGQVTVPMPNDV